MLATAHRPQVPQFELDLRKPLTEHPNHVGERSIRGGRDAADDQLAEFSPLRALRGADRTLGGRDGLARLREPHRYPKLLLVFGIPSHAGIVHADSRWGKGSGAGDRIGESPEPAAWHTAPVSRIALTAIAPMHPTREPFHRDASVYEEKFDGWRVVAYKTSTNVRIVSRRGVDHTMRRAR